MDVPMATREPEEASTEALPPLEVGGVEYDLGALLALVRPPSFIPPRQRGHRGDEIPFFERPTERAEWMSIQRRKGRGRFRKVLLRYPQYAPALMSVEFRRHLYLEWIMYGEQERIDGSPTERDTLIWGSDPPATPDVPSDPPGTEGGVLPEDWYNRFIDTVFVNAWIRWHMLAYYRAMQYFWGQTADSHRLEDEFHNNPDLSAGERTAHQIESAGIIRSMQNMAVVFDTMNIPQSLMPYELSRDGLDQLDAKVNQKIDKVAEMKQVYQQRVRSIALNRSVRGRVRPIIQRQVESVNKEIHMKEYEIGAILSAMEWGTGVLENRDEEQYYPRHEASVAEMLGLLTLGDYGTLLFRLAAINEMVRLARMPPNGQRHRLQIMHTSHIPNQPPFRAILNIDPSRPRDPRSGFCLWNFTKGMSWQITHLNRTLYEASKHIEVFRVPTVRYKLVPGLTHAFDNIWTHGFSIGNFPYKPLLVFDIPVTLRAPGSLPEQPFTVRPGYIGGLFESYFRLINVRLAHYNNLLSLLENMINDKHNDIPGGGRSTIVLHNVTCGPMNRIPPIDEDPSRPGRNIRNTLVVRVDSRSAPLVRMFVRNTEEDSEHGMGVRQLMMRRLPVADQ
jgi:hypothetical protein